MRARVFFKVFYEVDEDLSGFIEADELHHAIARLGYKMTPTDCEEVLEKIDENSDGRVSLHEFVTFFRHVPLVVRLRAEAEAAKAAAGCECTLDLGQKMGMVKRLLSLE